MLIKTDPSIIAGYLEDASGFTQGTADRLVIPENANEIADFLKAAAEKKNPITIAGGRTGVAAGCIPCGGTILSLERLNQMDKIVTRPEGKQITVEPAVRLDTLKAAVGAAGLIYGPDPTERTGTLGGNVATNASGGQCFKYGTTRQHVVGIEAVLTTGETLKLQRGQHISQGNLLQFPLESGKYLECSRPDLPGLGVEKNAAGYFSAPNMDPLDLLIGMDGTLAVITKITLRLLPEPAGIFAMAIFFTSIPDAAACATIIRSAAKGRQPISGITPAALEFMDKNALDLIRDSFSNIPKNAEAVLMIDQEYAAGQEDATLTHWNNFFEKNQIPEKMIWIAESKADRNYLREFRHALPETVNTIVRQRKFRKVGTDMAVPCDAFPEMLDIYYQTLNTSGLEYLIFGHIGECHLHVNILPRTQDEFDTAKQLYMDFARAVVAHAGTVSAEHGIGKIKHAFFKLMVGETGFMEMARIKKIFDPAQILNRGNIFPEDYLE
ncbi:FAD-binding oxidoreductase [bacterium]|nr:FAD-binding oxidoreductase [bacterium]